MSREIKFRAWDYDTNIMVYPDSELETTFCFDKVGLSVYHNNGQEMSSFELMQYTGIKDKNGKEVYEGDIIKYSSDVINSFYRVNEIFREVRFKYGMYGIKGIEDGTHIPFGNILKCQYEVIGNIYENPELLEEEQLCYIMQE